MSGLTPRSLFRGLAVAEAITWALLLTGMFLKYVTETTELGVQVFGMVHGVVFIAYCLVTLLVATDQRWSLGRLALGLVAAVPPFATLLFESVRRPARAARRRVALAPRQPDGPRARGVLAAAAPPAHGRVVRGRRRRAHRRGAARRPAGLSRSRPSGQSPRCSLFQVWGVATPETAMRSRDW